MPAEWEPHAATWLAWPHNTVTWPDQLPQVQEIFLRMIAALQEHEIVHLLVNDAATAVQVEQRLGSRGRQPEHLVLHQWRTADVWLRDSGPIFLTAAAGNVTAISDKRLGVQRLGWQVCRSPPRQRLATARCCVP